ncbi:MAG TPA: flagellar hook capping FlgD N-terminal domain-containing protein [Lacunisphaera sp.]|jgi:flagellar basal-body rod modification protein FlgD
MTVNSVAAPIDPAISTPVTSTGPQALGSADFMKLLAVQFQSQDPMQPMDDTAFIAQMAQFTSLSQTQTMTAEMVKMDSSQQLASANSFLGKQVVVDNGQGGTDSGTVSGVQVDPTNGPQLIIGNNAYSMSSVLYVQPVPDSTSTSTTTPAAATTSSGS